MQEKRLEIKDKPALAIVGAGIVGLCTALEAQREGFTVTLIDRDAPGLGASFGNAGYLATELIDPLGTPETLKLVPKLWMDPKGPLCLPPSYLPKLTPWLLRFLQASRAYPAQQGRSALAQLNQASVSAWQRCLTAVGAQSHLVQCGYLLVWETANQSDARSHQAFLNDWEIESELVTGDDVMALEPEISQRVHHALHFPGAYRVSDPYRLCETLFHSFLSQGGIFTQQLISRLVPHTDKVQLVTDTHQPLTLFDRVILCTGAWGKEMIAKLGLQIPVEAERGYHLTYPSETGLLRHLIGSADRRCVISPLESGTRVVGMTELGGLRLAPIKKRYGVLQHHAQCLFPKLAKQTEVEEWMGHRPTLPDSLPVIDQHPHYPNILFAFGNQHLGVTQAAATAELIVAKALNKTCFMSTDPFSAKRFS